MNTLDGLSPIFISPPFGQFFRSTQLSPIIGSYTLEARPGRYSQAMKTIRPTGKGGWLNRIGLRNPGIDALLYPKNNTSILSIAAIHQTDWFVLSEKIQRDAILQRFKAIELNISCPNVATGWLAADIIPAFSALSSNVIIKLPPRKSALDFIKQVLPYGFQQFHLSNSFKTKRGGLSGNRIKNINLSLIKAARKKFGNEIKIIAGGGIYNLQDAMDYTQFNVNGFSLGTVCYQPWKLPTLIKQLQKLAIED